MYVADKNKKSRDAERQTSVHADVQRKIYRKLEHSELGKLGGRRCSILLCLCEWYCIEDRDKEIEARTA